MSRKTTLDNLYVHDEPAAVGPAATPATRVRPTSIHAMQDSLRQMSEGAKIASRLQEQIATSVAVMEIDPSLIDASATADRIAIAVDPSFDALVESLRTSGQQVPILVRPVASGRFQIAYGRRRLRAALALGTKVKAIVRGMTDDELIVAQGNENLERKDLSFVERALFASRLQAQGFDRAVIMRALSINKDDLSRYTSVVRTIPSDLIQAIGPAPKAGRRPWLNLAEKLSTCDQAVAQRVIDAPDFQRLTSDERFFAVLKALTLPPSAAKPAKTSVVRSADGKKLAALKREPNGVSLVLQGKRHGDFVSFVAEELPALYARFLDRSKA